jgi:hypothetical protein
MRVAMGRVGFCVLAGVVASAVAAPGAQALRAPRWLKAPYRRYTLTYDAADASQGHAVTSFPDAQAQSGGCGAQITTYDGSETSHERFSYRFLFGHSRVHGRTHVAFVYQLATHSGPGQVSVTESSTMPPRCSTDNLPPGYLRNGACSQRSAESARPNLDVLTPHTSHHALVFGLEVMPSLDLAGDPTCSGDLRDVTFSHFAAVYPGTGVLSFSDRGVAARKTFRGAISTDPPNAHSGSGTDPENGLTPQSAWSFTTGLRATLALAPSR